MMLFGAHTVDENLGYGDYVFFQAPYRLQNLTDFVYCVAVSEKVNNDPNDRYIRGRTYDGIYSGLKFEIFGNTSAEVSAMETVLKAYCDNGQADAIQFITCIPRFCIGNIQSDDDDNYYGVRANRTYSFNQNSIDGYVPKNNKLFCFPYNVIELTNDKGQNAVYKPELFSSFGTCNFEIMSNMNGNVVVMCFPSNYAKCYTDTDEGYFNADEGITIENFPQVAWTSDFYKNWLAQNSYGNNIQLGVGIGNSLMTGGIGVATGNPIGVGMGLRFTC